MAFNTRFITHYFPTFPSCFNLANHKIKSRRILSQSLNRVITANIHQLSKIEKLPDEPSVYINLLNLDPNTGPY